MYDPTKLSEPIRFARVETGSTIVDVYPGDGDWTRLISDAVGPEGQVYSFVPAEVAHFKNDPFGRMRTLASRPRSSTAFSVERSVQIVDSRQQLIHLEQHLGPGTWAVGRSPRANA